MNNKEEYIRECKKIKATEKFKHETAEKMRESLQTKKHSKARRMLKWAVPSAVAAILVCVFVILPGINPQTVSAKENLMDGITAQPLTAIGKEGESTDFINAQADFSVKLFKNTVKKNKKSLVSPPSVSLALGMAANGAKGNTLKEFENVLGGGMDIESLNRELAWESTSLRSAKEGKINIANSIWYDNKGLNVQKNFLQKNADYFGAGAFSLDFADKNTLPAINGWVKENTGGKIDKAIDRITPDNVMYLINAVYFEQGWQSIYQSSSKGTFHAAGKDVTSNFMYSTEVYLHDNESDGILKPLKGGRYSFAAILPKKGIGVSDYVNGMTAEKYLSLVKPAKEILSKFTENGKIPKNYKETYAISSLPKFKYDYSLSLKEALKSMGLNNAFDSGKADFSNMGKSGKGNIFIGDVMHKTFIQVDELGVKAGAYTGELMAGAGEPPVNRVTFDRPFVYAIVDNETCLPLFIGTVENPNA